MGSRASVFTLFLTPFALFQAASPASKPLTRVDVLALVAGGVPSERVAKYLEKRGINFEPGDDYFDILKATRAQEPVFAALRKARVASTDSGGTPAGVKHPEPSAPSPEAAAKESAIIQHLLKATKLDHPSCSDALEEFRAASQLDRDDPFLRYDLATGPLRRDRDAQIQELRETIRLEPEFAEAHLALGTVLGLKGDSAVAAAAEYRKSVRLAPDSVTARMAFGSSLELARDLDGAISQYLAAIRLKPGLPETHLALGRILDKKGDRDAAQVQFRLASELRSSSPVYPPDWSMRIRRIRVGGQVENAKQIFAPKPQYPLVAKMGHIEGTVRLEAIISEDGAIQDLKILAGHPLLVKAAVEAVSRWRYQPTLLDCRPAEVITEIDINFTLAP